MSKHGRWRQTQLNAKILDAKIKQFIKGALRVPFNFSEISTTIENSNTASNEVAGRSRYLNTIGRGVTHSRLASSC